MGRVTLVELESSWIVGFTAQGEWLPPLLQIFRVQNLHQTIVWLKELQATQAWAECALKKVRCAWNLSLWEWGKLGRGYRVGWMVF